MSVRESEDVGKGVGRAARELGEEVVEAEPDGAVVDVGREGGDEGVCDEAGVEEELVGLGECGEERGVVMAGDAVRRGYGIRGWGGVLRRWKWVEGGLTAHEPEVECEDSVVLGKYIWRDDDVKRTRWFVVQVQEVEGPGIASADVILVRLSGKHTLWL